MKKIIISLISVVFAVSCASTAQVAGIPVMSARLLNTSIYSAGDSPIPLIITPVQVDLEVSDKKISYHLEVTDNIRMGGLENIVRTAVREALDINGGDVLVGLEKQIKYNSAGKEEYISITGYPAKYVNFRTCDNPELLTQPAATSNSESAPLSILKKK